ncbi:MAG: OmpH family outer membrane protein [Pontiellaceae bacterium]
MKLYLLILTTFLLLPTYADQKIAFVDLKELFESFYKTELAQDQINQQISEVTFERDLRMEDIKIIQEEIEKLRLESRDNLLTEEAKKNKRLQLEDRLIEMQEAQIEMKEYESLRKKQIEEQNIRMQKGLINEIQSVIINYAEEKSFDCIIDSSAGSSMGTDLVLFIDEHSDVTAEVLQILNKGYGNKLGY